MAKKDRYVPHQKSEFNKAQGRKTGEAPKEDSGQRERNVGHEKAEEHSRTAKGNRDQRAQKNPRRKPSEQRS
jgi:hypothetical protein